MHDLHSFQGFLMFFLQLIDSSAKYKHLKNEELEVTTSQDTQQRELRNPPTKSRRLEYVDISSNEPPESKKQSSETNFSRLSIEVKYKTENLRRLKMVQMYRKKNDLRQLKDLIIKWRHCAQEALYDLQTALPSDGHKVSLSHFVDLYGLDEHVLHFDRTEDSFTDL
uniref:Swi5-dependent recombination DNA repair protein 1 homolog n=1 Tax=Denticeps clupeoides TaxID=299321 RepID=A0AAY4E0P5_9TELE